MTTFPLIFRVKKMSGAYQKRDIVFGRMVRMLSNRLTTGCPMVVAQLTLVI